MRQSEGTRSEKRLSAIRTETRPGQAWSNHDRPPAKAIESPAPAALAWIARIRSPLLLKTASVMPTKNRALPRCPRIASIAASGPLGNVRSVAT
jgi:hypothetical protein